MRALLALALALGWLAPACVAAAAAPASTTAKSDCSLALPLETPRANYTRAITTASIQAQAYFDLGMVLAFAFNHEEAARSFTAARQADPTCVSCAVGLAMAHAPNINRPGVSAEALAEAQAAVQGALASPALAEATAVEQAWLQAAARRFPPERTLENGDAYDAAYRDALRQMVQDYPEDGDLPAFFAEAAMTTMPWDYYDEKDGEPRALTVEVLQALEAVLGRDPAHPLALHLFIHAIEPSAQPALALPAARTLASLPWGEGYGHMVHMPGHIFLRVGAYHDASEANRKAIELDRRYFARCRVPPGAYYRQLYFTHKHAFLLFSLGMEGRKQDALQTALELTGECDIDTVARTLGGTFVSYTAWPWLTHLRFGEFDAVLDATEGVVAVQQEGEEGASSAVPTMMLPYTRVMLHYTRAFALASLADGPRCGAALAEAEAFQRLASNETTRDTEVFLVAAGDLFDVANATLWGRLASAGCINRYEAEEGVAEEAEEAEAADGQAQRLRQGAGRPSRRRRSVAVREWERAVELVDAFPYMEPPFWSSNVRACLGQALLEEGRYLDAQRVFENDLGVWRENGWSLKGLGLALKGQGKEAEAWVAKKGFEAAWQHADTDLGDRSCF